MGILLAPFQGAFSPFVSTLGKGGSFTYCIAVEWATGQGTGEHCLRGMEGKMGRENRVLNPHFTKLLRKWGKQYRVWCPTERTGGRKLKGYAALMVSFSLHALPSAWGGGGGGETGS